MAEEKQEIKKEQSADKKIAVIRITGRTKLKKEIISTLAMLNLPKKNSCVIVPANPSMMGMIKRVKDYVTWGDIDDETSKLLKEKKDKGKKFFSLNPPKGGYGRKGTKMPFKLGGALGPRKEKINDIIKRMI